MAGPQTLNAAQALHQFWSGFSWAAYDESTVPDRPGEPAMPRITYNVSFAEFESPVAMAASLWDNSYSWEDVSLKADEIYNAIGLGGTILHYDDGMIWIKRGSPFAQRIQDENDAIRRIYLNIEAEYFTAK